MTRRHPHWETRLQAFARAARGQAFEWGQWDCVLLAFRAIDCMLGAGPGGGLTAKWAGRWSNRREALVAAGRTTLEEELARAGGLVWNACYAQPGDVLVLTGRRLPYASIYLGSHQLAVTPRHGVELFTLGRVLVGDGVRAVRVP